MKVSFKNLTKFLLLGLLTSGSFSFARWATPQDAHCMEDLFMEIKVKADGTYTVFTESKEKVLTEKGRNQHSLVDVFYNSDASKVDIIEAYTLTPDNKKIPLDKDHISDKPVHMGKFGFDEVNQIKLGFKNLEVGGSIVKKQSRNVLKSDYPGVFQTMISPDGYVKSYNLKLESEIPLYLVKNDPRNHLEVKNTVQNGKTYIEISLKKPIFESIINEVSSIFSKKNSTYVIISSLKDWKSAEQVARSGYEKVLSQEIPATFKNIAEQASKEKNDIDKINKVTSLVKSKIKYLGNWRSVQGRLAPRDLKTVAETQVGDCKDFSTVTVAILRSLGYDAHVSLVGVDEINQIDQYKEKLPYLWIFNHAIAYVKLPNNREIWLDPTTEISMAGLIPTQLANNTSLILKDDKVLKSDKDIDSNKDKKDLLNNTQSDDNYKHIPELDYSKSGIDQTSEVAVQGNDLIYKGQFTLKNERASRFTAIGLFLPEEQIKDHFFRILSGKTLDTDEKINLVLPDLKSRTVKDIKAEYTFKVKEGTVNTNVGRGFSVNLVSALKPIISWDIETNVGELVLGEPFSEKRVFILKNKDVPNIDRMNLSISNKYFDVTRKLFTKDKDTFVEVSTTIKQRLIPMEVLKSEEFKKWKYTILDNFIIYLISENFDK